MRRHGITANRSLSVLSIVALLLTIFSPNTLPFATAAPPLVTCINLQTKTERISHTGSCRYTQEAQANWHKNQSDSPIASGASAKVITVCSNKESSPVSYQVIRSKCAKHQVTTVFSRSGALPARPLITQVVSFGYDSSQISLAQNTEINSDAPIAFYTITSSRGNTHKIYTWKDLSLVITGLQAQTTYTFTVSATTADGTSPISASSLPVTTPAYVPPATSSTTAPLAAPAFTLTSNAETKTVNIAATGFTINSTGGAIATFAISATPPGMNFNTITGALTGTPNTVTSATAYTVTATNASGSATRTFTLTVTAVIYTVGQTGPGGGLIFYVDNVTGFSCGATYTTTGSPTGGLCHYLEVAPSGWENPTSDPAKLGAVAALQSTDVSTIANEATAYNNALGIGLGYKNSVAIVNQGNDNTTAAGFAREYLGGSLNDWYLPTTAELNLLCQWSRGVTPDVTTRCTGGSANSATYGASSAGFGTNPYWSSSESNSTNVWVQFINGGIPIESQQLTQSKPNGYRVRPIRAF